MASLLEEIISGFVPLGCPADPLRLSAVAWGDDFVVELPSFSNPS